MKAQVGEGIMTRVCSMGGPRGVRSFTFFYVLVLRRGRSLRGHLHGDAGEESPPSGGVLLGLESGMGRGTGRATGGGGGSKKEPGILLWPLPFGCRQHK